VIDLLRQKQKEIDEANYSKKSAPLNTTESLESNNLIAASKEKKFKQSLNFNCDEILSLFAKSKLTKSDLKYFLWNKTNKFLLI
jgi:3-oxoacyl-[acyl-carrier-protein] synthase III